MRATPLTRAVTAALAGVLLVPGAMLLPASTARAQALPAITCDAVADLPCDLQVEAVGIRSAPDLMKLQARVAQAKLPLGQGLIQKLYVKLLRGQEQLCVEEFHDVIVNDSVLNLEIGREMNCDIHEMITAESNTALQVCLGDITTCVEPIALVATPYAFKAMEASYADRAHRVDRAAQAHYAHRAAADADLADRNTLVTGYVDFTTPPEGALVSVLGPVGAAAAASAGFILWTPVLQRGARSFHVAGKAFGSGKVEALEQLVLDSRQVTFKGDVLVDGAAQGLVVVSRGAHVSGNSEVTGDLYVIDGDMTVTNDVVVAGPSPLLSGALQTGSMVIESENLDVNGPTVLGVGNGLFSVAQNVAVQSGGVHVAGAMNAVQGLTVGADLVVPGSVTVNEEGAVNGNLHVAADLQANEIHAAAFEAPIVNTSNATAVRGAMHVTGDVEFRGNATFLGGVSIPGAAPDPSFALANGETRPIALGAQPTFGGGLAVGGPLVGAQPDGQGAAPGQLKRARFEVANGPPVTCDAFRRGYIYLDRSLGTLRVCISGNWESLGRTVPAAGN